MPAPRVRVRPPHKHSRMLFFSAIAGMICGILCWVVKIYLSRAAIHPPIWLEIVLTISGGFLVTIYWGWSCQHKLPTFLGCFIFVCTMVGTNSAILLRFRQARGQTIPGSEALLMIGVTLLLGLLCGLLGLLMCVICANMISRLVPRVEHVCANCGYDLRGQTEARCPECGKEFDARLLNNSIARTRVRTNTY